MKEGETILCSLGMSEKLGASAGPRADLVFGHALLQTESLTLRRGGGLAGNGCHPHEDLGNICVARFPLQSVLLWWQLAL